MLEGNDGAVRFYGPGRVWGGGEAMAMRAVRDELGGRGVRRRSMQAMGYWKHDGTPEEMW